MSEQDQKRAVSAADETLEAWLRRNRVSFLDVTARAGYSAAIVAPGLDEVWVVDGNTVSRLTASSPPAGRKRAASGQTGETGAGPG